MIQTQRRDELKQFLAERGIGTAIHYPAIVPDLKPYLTKGDFQSARNLANHGLSLPLNSYLKVEELGFVIDSVCKFFR